MAVYFRNLVDGQAGQLTTSLVTYYTAGSTVMAKITNATAVNTSGSSATFTVYIVYSGGTAGDPTLIIDQKTVQSLETYTCPELLGKNIPQGATIQALASANTAITFHVSGIEAS